MLLAVLCPEHDGRSPCGPDGRTLHRDGPQIKTIPVVSCPSQLVIVDVALLELVNLTVQHQNLEFNLTKMLHLLIPCVYYIQ